MPAPGRFEYLFRFCGDPGFHEEDEAAKLAAFVRTARIDDVLLFANVQELNTGHTTPEELEAYIGMMERLRPAIEGSGATLSINHWPTIQHFDMGKRLRPGQDFRLMVDPDGREATLCACPLDEAWRDALAATFARLADLRPNILWVEDDFRFHNHAPLRWGGCFCDRHLALYSDMAGHAVSREAFVAGVLRPGAPHPYRAVWLDACRDVLVDAARRLGDAVHARSPETRVGLMSSSPEVHCAEGRDWDALLHAFAGATPPVDRVHLPCYAERVASEYLARFHTVSMLNRFFLPPDAQIYPELENFPYSRFSKSRRFTRFELLAAVPLGMTGVTIDLFDLNGNGIVWESGYQDMLAGAKDFLEAVTATGLPRSGPSGVLVLADPRSSYTLHTTEGRRMEELYPKDMYFGGLLPSFGIPFAYAGADALAAARGRVVALSGQSLRTLAPDAIAALFRDHFVLLDGEAAATLADLGLGRLAGIAEARWMDKDSGEFMYEQVADGAVYCGMRDARATAAILGADALAVRYDAQDVRVLSRLHDSARRIVAPGLVLVGGSVCVYPFGRFEDPLCPPQALLNDIRQAMMQRVLALASARFDAPPFVVGEPYVFPTLYDTRGGTGVAGAHAGDADGTGGFALYLTNAATDDLDRVRLDVGDRPVARVHALTPDRPAWTEVPFSRDGRILTLDFPLASLESALLRFGG